MASLLSDLKKEFFERYQDKNGLAFLQDEAEDKLDFVRNENGILFKAYGYALFYSELTPEDKASGLYTVLKLRNNDFPWLFNRTPNNFTRSEAHDNYDGIVAIDIMCGGNFSEIICAGGVRNGWSFPNQAPQTFSWKQLRQGGSIAFYKIGAGWVPYPLEMVWLCLGLIFSMLFGWASTHNLAWLKLEVIPMALGKQKSEKWQWVNGWFGLTQAICAIIDSMKKIFLNSWKIYFGEKHIFTRAYYERNRRKPNAS